MTIRRDLDWLASKALVTRIHGGAAAYPARARVQDEKSFEERSKEYNFQKNSIGLGGRRSLSRTATALSRTAGRPLIILPVTWRTRKIDRDTNNLPVVAEVGIIHRSRRLFGGQYSKQQRTMHVAAWWCAPLASLSAGKLFLTPPA